MEANGKHGDERMNAGIQRTVNKYAKTVPANRLDCFMSSVALLEGDPAAVKRSVHNLAYNLRRDEIRFGKMKERLASMPARHVDPDTTMENQEIVDVVNSKLTEKERAILADYKDGMLIEDLCSKHHVSFQTWYAIKAKIKSIIEPYL